MASTHLAVIGSPIEHSKSPLIHNAAYGALGLGWDYGRYKVEANELSYFLKLRDQSWRGFSLTMPLKEIGYELSIPSCPVASETGVVNTLLHTDAGWEGYNTDSFGIQKAVKCHTDKNFDLITVLGSGATAKSAVHAARQLNSEAEIRLFARRDVVIDGVTSKPLADFFEATATELTISTLPGGLVLPSVSVAEDAVILDVAYNPWPSRLALDWQEANRISGIEMLLWQALIQLRIFKFGDGTVHLENEEKVFEAMRASVQG
jgi:shikimate dehydrogenase